jgi:hypothetical protein
MNTSDTPRDHSVVPTTAKTSVGTRLSVISLLWLSLIAAPALGQTAAPPPETVTNSPEVGSSLTADTIANLPLAENVYSLLETTQAEVISDRFNGSGLNVGENARLGGFLGSWSQTSFRIGDIDITDPSGSGAPLLFPELTFWDRVTVATGLMPIDFNTPGLGVTLTPLLPGAKWNTTALGSVSGGSLASPTPSGSVPPIARLNDFGYASALTSGPLIANRLGLVAGGSWARASKFQREVVPTTDSDLASGFAHLVYRPAAGVESRTLAWAQQTTVPFAYRQLFAPDASTRDRAVHVQSVLDRRLERFRWRIDGGYTERFRTNDIAATGAITADRLTDGPIPAIAAATGNQAAGLWTANGRIQPRPTGDGRHLIEAGATVERSFVRTSHQFSGTIGELVDGTPARRWFFSHPDGESRSHTTTIAAFANDRLVLSPTFTVDAGIRFESITGRADGAASDISWQTLLPRADVRWQFGNKALVGGYRRSANRLNLDLLAFGDPNAETALVSRLVSAPLGTAVVIDRVGPGTGGNPAFSRIDPGLKRPYTDEYVVGIESRRRGWLLVGLTGIARREANLIAVQDVGVPLSSYSTIGIPDPGHDFASTADDQTLTAYNRLPASFGRNQYVLTNSGEQAATVFGLKLWAQGSTDKLSVLFAATASAANGSAANRGYGPLENDQDAVGELQTDPNAATFARGRLFSDRAFTIKWTTTYRFPGGIRVGAIARYQDGQPFARLVPVLDLNQGAELIRAYPNAGNRFTFTGTLDVRVQKRFAVGKQRLDGIVDFYNLATRSNEVEEFTATGPDFRRPTAIEPPRSVHIGLRLLF